MVISGSRAWSRPFRAELGRFVWGNRLWRMYSSLELAAYFRMSDLRRAESNLHQAMTPKASPLAATIALTWREMVRFFRQPNRIVGSIGTPLVFWLLLGAGLSGSFRLSAGASEQSFLTYFFPGSLLLIVLFTAIFSSISIIEDRREGF